MFTTEEEMIASRLGITEEDARKGQIDGNYRHLRDYLIMECLRHDRGIFNELDERICKKYKSFKDLQTVWEFLKKLEKAVEELEK